ncbi:ABC transporter ATP-binding protein [Candidatus Poriferisodalis sp.]|uniref:ABC transporter ATP-binding protein n=1 Tax=Candidatus Poriferisodalis sp. TaxID=3101277 RepID=UPI003B02157D
MITATGIDLRLGAVDVLSGAQLSTRPGQVVGLIGPNGSGKSSLLRCLYGMLRPHRGAVLIDDVAIGSMSQRSIARAVAVVTQDTSADGIDISVGEFVLLGRHVHRSDYQGFTDDDRKAVLDGLDMVDMSSFADRSIHNLSGGERQRVLIARCIAQQSPVILLDEPTNHLDVRYQHEVLALVRHLQIDSIVVLHDLNLASRYCDHLALLDHGSVVQQGRPDDVLQSEVLGPVYGIEVRRLADGPHSHFAFGPLST